MSAKLCGVPAPPNRAEGGAVGVADVHTNRLSLVILGKRPSLARYHGAIRCAQGDVKASVRGLDQQVVAGLGVVQIASAIEIGLIGVAVKAREHDLNDLKIAAPRGGVLPLSDAVPRVSQREEPHEGKEGVIEGAQG